MRRANQRECELGKLGLQHQHEMATRQIGHDGPQIIAFWIEGPARIENAAALNSHLTVGTDIDELVRLVQNVDWELLAIESHAIIPQCLDERRDSLVIGVTPFRRDIAAQCGDRSTVEYVANILRQVSRRGGGESVGQVLERFFDVAPQVAVSFINARLGLAAFALHD